MKSGFMLQTIKFEAAVAGRVKKSPILEANKDELTELLRRLLPRPNEGYNYILFAVRFGNFGDQEEGGDETQNFSRNLQSAVAQCQGLQRAQQIADCEIKSLLCFHRAEDQESLSNFEVPLESLLKFIISQFFDPEDETSKNGLLENLKDKLKKTEEGWYGSNYDQYSKSRKFVQILIPAAQYRISAVMGNASGAHNKFLIVAKDVTPENLKELSRGFYLPLTQVRLKSPDFIFPIILGSIGKNLYLHHFVVREFECYKLDKYLSEKDFLRDIAEMQARLLGAEPPRFAQGYTANILRELQSLDQIEPSSAGASSHPVESGHSMPPGVSEEQQPKPQADQREVVKATEVKKHAAPNVFTF